MQIFINHISVTIVHQNKRILIDRYTLIVL